MIAYNLTGGKTQSCGCAQREAASDARRTHGLSQTRLYRVYKGIKSRCYNRNNSAFSRYGGRGIVMCDEWANDFASFYAWAHANGYEEDAERFDCTIDRIDNDGPYAPGNCRWVTMERQNNNKFNSAFITVGSERRTVAEWAKTQGISAPTMYSRLYTLFGQFGVNPEDVGEVSITLR